MRAEDIQTGMILNWQSTTWPDKKSQWIVLEELETMGENAKMFNIFCIYTSSGFPVVNTPTTYTFHNENIHRFTIHSQI
jgi:hypothetical protein